VAARTCAVLGLSRRGFLRHVGWRRASTLLVLALLVDACNTHGSRAADTPGSGARQVGELHRGELTDFVPAAGLRWLIAGSPATLAREPALAALRERWLTDERLAAFARVTGISLAATRRGLVAGYDLGTLYMADGSAWVAPPERVFAERLAGTEMLRQSHPRVWRVTGLVGSEPEALVRVADDLVAVAVGDPMLARIVELFAERRLSRTPPVFQGAALSALPADLRQPQALAFYWLGPFDADWIREGSSLLAAAHAVVATLELRAATLVLRLAVTGSWDPAADRARLAEAWRAFSASSLGVRLSLDRPLTPPEVSGSQALQNLRTELDASAFAAGLEALFVNNIDDILGFTGAPGDTIAPACDSSGYACVSGGRQDRPDGQLTFDVGGRTVRWSDRSSAGGGEPGGGARVQSGRLDQRRAHLGRAE
jgi:hypothetical protein